MSRDLKKDMETIKYLQSWRLDPGGVEDGAAFYTIEEDGIQTEIKADNMLDEDAWKLNDAFLALEYYHRQYAAEKERADKLEMNLEATEGLTRAETKRADSWREHGRKLSIDLQYAEAREQKLKEAIETVINEKEAWRDSGNALDVVTRYLKDTLNSLYPKKGAGT
ncbi:hypothetical protein [Paenibacillus campinasensis]|uniref:Uncharacterized protein n=1 Tax=Paenibacillus campinasensis TaxID=66347 RepID=A0A268EI89_9BACL|nr:hypothetical protein [Paenibacillus campinasensis]PAD72848.1 hypothetical protein CHH67_21310 [Paenibacillus campinasensis]